MNDQHDQHDQQQPRSTFPYPFGDSGFALDEPDTAPDTTTEQERAQ